MFYEINSDCNLFLALIVSLPSDLNHFYEKKAPC